MDRRNGINIVFNNLSLLVYYFWSLAFIVINIVFISIFFTFIYVFIIIILIHIIIIIIIIIIIDYIGKLLYLSNRIIKLGKVKSI